MSKSSDEIVQKVTDFLNKNHVEFYALGIDPSHKGVKRLEKFPWKITIISRGEMETFDFFQGKGHVTKHGIPTKPDSVSVLYCLIADADAWDHNFYHWCDNYGYAVDSIIAFKTYTECLENAKKLRKLFTTIQLIELKELLQDY